MATLATRLVVFSAIAACLCACKSDPAPAPAPPVTAAAPEPASAQAPTLPNDVPAFLAAVAKHRKAPQKMGSEPPECETKGPSKGQCTTFADISDDNAVDVRYFKSTPTAVRFTAHFPRAVTCLDMGAAQRLTWQERRGMLGAGGYRCEFKSGDLAGLQVLIELNKNPQGQPNTGVHVYAPEFAERDRDFADGVAQDEAKAR